MMKLNKIMKKPSCAYCNEEMRFTEGDIIFGEKWYHKDCAHKYRNKNPFD